VTANGAGDPAPPVLDARTVRTDVGAFDRERDVVTVAGPDASSYLQGQMSADVASLDVGASTWSLLLEPNGKLCVWGRVTRTGEAELLVDIDRGWGEVAIARLRRFLLRVDVSLELATRRCVALRGPNSRAGAGRSVGPGVVAVDVDWRGLAGVDLLDLRGQPSPLLPEIARSGPGVWNELRVEQGWPEMGCELDASTIPAEAGEWLIESSVSFDKGCYTGQELVARVRSRGSNTPRHLRGLRFEGGVVPAPGAPVLCDGAERATVTSSTFSHQHGVPIALAMLHRSVEPGATVDVGGSDATVVPLPFS